MAKSLGYFETIIGVIYRRLSNVSVTGGIACTFVVARGTTADTTAF